jgi:hypothetical protein
MNGWNTPFVNNVKYLGVIRKLHGDHTSKLSKPRPSEHLLGHTPNSKVSD